LLDPPVSSGFHGHIAGVVKAALNATKRLTPDHIMVVGACCRDILHDQLGHRFLPTATLDLDLALALSTWDAYGDLAAVFEPVGNSGIRFHIAGADVDLLPFGAVERPEGVVEPPSRGEALSVWAFEEIFRSSYPLTLDDSINIPRSPCTGMPSRR
jgi:predicted nucleotidyltransferase